MLAILLFLFYSAGDHSDPHSFPTRRSSDLRASEGTSRPEKRRLPDEVPNSRSGSAPRRAWSTTTPGIGNLIWEPSLLDRKSTRLNSSHVEISYAVFCLKKKKKNIDRTYKQD